ncbi:MAG: hypothetical protein M0R73_01265 [Dehalococcoidia bacterium]|nr:hypothetical protein [Dehalococcoidia bacterium]
MTDWQAFIGIAAVPSVLPLLVEHVKAAVRAARGHSQGTPWPLVTDAAAVGWVFALWDAGLLSEATLRPTTVLLLGLAAGAAAGLGYDGWRRLRSGPGDTAGDP